MVSWIGTAMYPNCLTTVQGLVPLSTINPNGGNADYFRRLPFGHDHRRG